MGDSASAFFQTMLSAIKKKLKPTKQDLEILCNQLDTWALFSPDDGPRIKSAAVSAVQTLQKHPELTTDDLMLRIYQLVAKHSGIMGASGVFDQIEAQGRFKSSYKFHYMWAQYHAEEKHVQKFREIFEMTLRRIKNIPQSEISTDFKAIADDMMPGLFDASEFGSFAAARNPRRRSSLAVVRQQAVQNIAPSTSNSTHRIDIKVELIDRDNYSPYSIEEIHAMAFNDHCVEPVDMDISMVPEEKKEDDDMDISVQDCAPLPPVRTPVVRKDLKKVELPHLTPVAERSERDSMSEKRKNIFSPIRTNPQKRFADSHDEEPTSSPVSFSEKVYKKAEAVFSDTVNFGPEVQPDVTMPVIQNPPDAFEVFEDPEQSVVQQPAARVSPAERKPLAERTAPVAVQEFEEEKPLFRPPVAREAKAFMPDVSAIENDSPGGHYNFADEPTLAGQKYGQYSNSDPKGIITSTPFGLSNRITHDEFFGGKDILDNLDTEKEADIFEFDSGNLRKKRMSMAKPLAVVNEKPFQEAPKDVTLTTAMSRVAVTSPVGADLDRTGHAGVRPIEDICGDVNPWDGTVRNTIMARHSVPTHQHEYKTPSPKIHRFKDLTIGGEVFQVKDLIGEGGFAKVFKCIAETGETVALKYEVPSCAWEVYICDQLKHRLEKNGQAALTKCIMEVTDAFVFKNASLLINEYHDKGTLLNVANNLRGSATSQLILFIAIQIASVLKEVHRAAIIHGDVKPDNIMVLSKVDENASAEELLAPGVLKFIDWGRAIDIKSMPVKEFKGRAGTADFDCPEMLKNMPWNYQTDFFGFVATMHTIIFGKYSKVQVDGRRNSMDQSMKRRLDCRTLMEGLFDEMLNMPSCNQLVDWDDAITKMSNFFKSQFNQLDWRQAARAFNESVSND